jgi:hypothetical protein
VPNLLPDWLPWIQPAGRLIWSTALLIVGLLFVLVLMKPPMLKRPFPDRVGYALFVIVPIVAYVVAVLLPDDANLWDWELDAIIVDLVLLFWAAHALLLVASREPRPADEKVSWSACYLGAIGVFALMTLAYGVVPHEWMEFANGYLQWGDTSKFLFQSNQEMLFFPWNWPFNFDYPALRDIVVSGIYGVLLGINIVLFVKWQDRKRVPEAAAVDVADTVPAKRSRFGRPVRRGQGRGVASPAGEGA